MNVVNKIKLLGEELTDKRIIEKVLVSLPERFETKISSLKDSKDLFHISLVELVHALHAQEQRRFFRQEDFSKGVMVASQKGRTCQGGNKRATSEKKGKIEKLLPGRKAWWFEVCKQFGHIEKVCKNKGHRQEQQVQVVENQQPSQETEQLFMASCSKLKNPGESIVKIGNGDCVDAKGRGKIVVQTPSEHRHKNEVMRVGMLAKRFPIKWKNSASQARSVKLDETEMWHKRIGHYHYIGLVQMKKKNLVDNLPKIDEK
ncbi:uncharacterized protein LOC116107777 [Pistacia vera]|uniref:uncharacterized protein LOC116107777 n=1 Tax=Pistacia vera TaxID=55513 RepID=UPI0012631D77|nr:uncharacterized protein LOC116107777 [Pistacia vera]